MNSEFMQELVFLLSIMLIYYLIIDFGGLQTVKFLEEFVELLHRLVKRLFLFRVGDVILVGVVLVVAGIEIHVLEVPPLGRFDLALDNLYVLFSALVVGLPVTGLFAHPFRNKLMKGGIELNMK